MDGGLFPPLVIVMYIDLTEDGRRLLLKSETPSDVSFLKKMPGPQATARGMDFWVDAKPWVVKNVLRRVKTHFSGNARISARAQAIRQSPFALLPLPAAFAYHTDPLEHQDIALQYLFTMKRMGLLLDPGLGKTKVVLDWIFLEKLTNPEFSKALVVCPKALLFVWVKQMRIHRPELKIHVLRAVGYNKQIQGRRKKLKSAGISEHQKRILQADIARLEEDRDEESAAVQRADIVLVNYAKVVQNPRFFTRNKWSLLAVDEALVKNPHSDQSGVITEVAHSTPCVTLMSGTLVNNSEGDAFSPTCILEPTLLGMSVHKFNEFYAVKTRRTITTREKDGSVGTRDVLSIIGYNHGAEIKEALHAVSLVMRKEAWLKDLPKKEFYYINVELSEDQKRVYDEIGRNYISVLPNGETVEVDNPLSCLSKLSQISSGFLYITPTREEMVDVGIFTMDHILANRGAGKDKAKKPRTSEPRRIYRFPRQPKIDALRKLHKTELMREKVVVWYNFGFELELLEDLAKEEGIVYRVVKGGTKDPGRQIDDFNEKPDVQWLICQAKAVNYGVTLLGTDLEQVDYEPELSTEVRTHVFYSLNYSLEVFIQQQDRSHRIGMKKSPRYFILRGDTSTERAISAKLVRKEVLREDFLEDTLKRTFPTENLHDIAVDPDSRHHGDDVSAQETLGTEDGFG